MVSSNPLVTIVTSTYRHEQYLRRTIDSVLNQDYPNIEYIVINDGSPDGTEEILKSYGDRIHWETQKNMGEVPTLNRAIAMSKGELIGKLSSDDYFYPSCISKIVQRFINDPQLMVVYTDFDIIDENDNFIQTIIKPDFDDLQAVRDHLCLPGTGTLFRKELFNELGGFYAGFRILFDMDFWWRASLLGKIVRLPEVLSAFRLHGASQSGQGGGRMAEETMQFMQRFYSISGLPARFMKIKNIAFSNAYYTAAMQAYLGKDRRLYTRYLLRSCLYSPACFFKNNWKRMKGYMVKFRTKNM